MTIEDKRKELRELRKIEFPSDQEFERIEQLESEIALEYEEPRIVIPEKKVDNTPSEPKEKRTVFEFVADKIREKRGKKSKQRDPNRKDVLSKIGSAIGKKVFEQPVTDQELYELKRKVIKYRLKADIANSKAKINRSKTGKLTVLEKLFVDDRRSTSRSKSRKSKARDFDFDDNKEVIGYRKKILGYR